MSKAKLAVGLGPIMPAVLMARVLLAAGAALVWFATRLHDGLMVTNAQHKAEMLADVAVVVRTIL
jgi:hypothetical protein